MIPKKLHFFWFGGAEKNPLFHRCYESWRKYLPDYEFFEWSERNYDVNKNNFTQRSYQEKKWAFLSDYARLDVLTEHGGIYVDTDLEVIKPLDHFLANSFFAGMESNEHANFSIAGSVSNHHILQEMIQAYDSLSVYKAIPLIFTGVLSRHIDVKNQLTQTDNLTIYPTDYFYPFGFEEKYQPSCITENTHAIHWWNHSWASPRAQLLKNIGLLRVAQGFNRWFRAK